MATREELDKLTSRELHDLAVRRALHRLDVEFFWELLRAIPEAEAVEGHDAQAASLVKLRYFAGLGHQEAAQALGVTRRAADRLWAVARAWLYQRIGER